MERLRGFLNRGLRELNAEEVIEAGRVFALWPEIVGPAIAAHSVPRTLRQGVLFVEVSSAAWANELNMLKPKILKSIEQKLGPGRVKDVRWQVAVTWREGKAHAPEVAPPPASPPMVELGEGREAIIESEVAEHVQDPGLAQVVGGLLSVLERRREAKRQAGYRPCSTCGVLVPPDSPERCPVCRLGQP